MMSNEDRKLRERAARQWDESVQKKAKLYDKGEQNHRELKLEVWFVGIIGIFVLVASILFGGEPDLMDGFVNYLMTCR